VNTSPAVTPLTAWQRSARSRGLKRAFDIAGAAVLLVLAAPVLLVLAIAVRLQLRRPALFRQIRVVGSGQLAEIIKLRTFGGPDAMWDPDTCWAPPGQQCTSLGRFLRSTHLDELPQLVNVLRGDMSLVGPRPERPYFAGQFGQEMPGYHDRNRMPAGLTGWAQVHGLNGDTSISDRVRLDNSYIENWSFRLDLFILARTVVATVVTAVASLTSSSRPASGSSRSAASSPRPAPGPRLAERSPAPELAPADSELVSADSRAAFSHSTRGGSR
jgi:lipopolysaccharide/colanic/teichoic acid biosynthesis glycosyltransferase